MFIYTLTILALVSAILTIIAKVQGLTKRVWIFKPITMVFVNLIVVTAVQIRPFTYPNLILLGLVFSLTGDVFLMLPKDRFLYGLSAFLIAHLLYIAAFTNTAGFGFTWWIASCLFLIGFIMSVFLLPHAGKMKLPVLFYIIVILTMVWQAWERWNSIGGKYALSAAVGAVLFLASDSLLAWNKFRKPVENAEVWKLSTYFLAQWMIAMSVRG